MQFNQTNKNKGDVSNVIVAGAAAVTIGSDYQELRDYALALADSLDATHRQGACQDVPEGAQFITISDTMACRIANRLRELVAIAEVNGTL